MGKKADDSDAAEDRESPLNKLTVWVNMPPGCALVCQKSLAVDLKHPGSKKTDVKISSQGDELLLEIEAVNLSTLRAALNTYIRMINMCSTIIPVNQ